MARLGEAVYLCSQSLSASTGVLPNGTKAIICRIPVAEYGEVTEYEMEHLQGYVEVGGLSLKALRFSLKDFA